MPVFRVTGVCVVLNVLLYGKGNGLSTKLERLLHLDTLIRSGSYPSVDTLATHFEVSQRTVYSDFQFLKDRLGAPLDYSRSHQGYFYTDKEWKLPSILVTEGQLLALFLSVELAHRYLGTSFEQPLREAIQQIIDILPHDVQVSMGELAQSYSIRRGASAHTPPETLMALRQAIQNRHPVDMLYFTAGRGQETQRIVHPHHLFNMHGEWYLVAYDLLRQNIRQFALPRIRTWRILTEERFERQPTFSTEEYFNKSFQAEHGDQLVEVMLHFDAYQARYMRERTWHPSQKIQDHSDGSIIMRFTTGALTEVQRQILSYGHHVKVLAPEHLARAVADELRLALQQYDHSS